MTGLTLSLYIGLVTLWALGIQREGKLGLGVRFAFGVNTVLVMVVGPLLIATLGNGTLSAGMDDAVSITLLGMIAFVVTGYYLYPLVTKRSVVLPADMKASFRSPRRLRDQQLVAWWLLGVGLLAEVGTPLAYSIPTVRAVWSQVTTLQNVALVMLTLCAALTRNWGRMATILGLTVGLGVLKASLTGHFGGILFLGVFLVCLGTTAFELRWARVSAVIPAVAFGLFLFFAWMSGREGLRAAINQGASLSDRLSMTAEIFLSPQFTVEDSGDFVDKYRSRGDFADLMAAAVEYTPAREPFAMGETIEVAVIAVVPRFLWPDKPYTAGGSAFVTRFTGIRFGEGTSVGMNLLFEFYVNFGVYGVVLGMGLIGLGTAWMDDLYARQAVDNLRLEWTLTLGMLVLVSVDTVALLAMSVPSTLVVAWAAMPAVRLLGGPDLSRMIGRPRGTTAGLAYRAGGVT